jgi:ParB-like chromosome segregation protein Spo0J
MEFYEHKIVSVEDLIPYALNSRTHSDEQVAQLAASIREFGFTNPVLIDQDANLLAGHGRLLAARKAKMAQVPAVVVTGLDDRKRRALVIADNKLALNAGWDEEALRVELEDLAGDFGELMGFSQDELLALLNFENPNFEPGTESDQGKLDELAPKMVTCPHCQTEWDLREHGQG